MAFRATNTLAEDAYKRIKQLANGAKVALDRANTTFDTTTGADVILSLRANLASYLEGMAAQVAAVPNADLIDAAGRIEEDPTYDAVVEYNAMVTAINAVIDEIVSTMPTDNYTWDVQTQGQVWNTFSPGALNSLQALVVTASASIE